MGLEIKESNWNIQQATGSSRVTQQKHDNPISVFGDFVSEHKTELGLTATGIGIVGTFLLARKKVPHLLMFKSKHQFPMSSTKPFSFGDATEIRNELKDFLEKDFMSQNQLKVKPDIFFDIPNTKCSAGGAGTLSPYDNYIILNREILNKKYYKIIDLTTKKCSVNAKTNWQRTGTFKDLKAIIDNEKLENVVIEPLTRAERMKVLKSIVAHEAFHSVQFAYMIAHPDIGHGKLLSELLRQQTKVSDKTKQQLADSMRKAWGDFSKSGEKIDPNSELGKRTMKQFKDWISNIKKAKDKTFTYEDYVNAAYEQEAYQKELEFAIKNNLLI